MQQRRKCKTLSVIFWLAIFSVGWGFTEDDQANSNATTDGTTVAAPLGSLALAVSDDSQEVHCFAAIQDFNGDGLFDIAMARADQPRVRVMFGTANDQLSPPIDYDVEVPADLDGWDVTGDGIADLVVSSRTGRTAIVLVNDGEGIFDDAYTIDMDVEPVGLLFDGVETDDEGGIDLNEPGGSEPPGQSDEPVVDRIPLHAIPFYMYPLTNGYPGGYFSDCGNEPQMPISPAGIQGCLSAAWARAASCHWAACVQYVGGDKGLLGTIGAHTACAVVADVEAVACVPQQFVP